MLCGSPEKDKSNSSEGPWHPSCWAQNALSLGPLAPLSFLRSQPPEPLHGLSPPLRPQLELFWDAGPTSAFLSSPCFQKLVGDPLSSGGLVHSWGPLTARLPTDEYDDRQPLTSKEEEERRIAEMGRPVLGEHTRLEVIIEESYEFKVQRGCQGQRVGGGQGPRGTEGTGNPW